MIRNPLKNRVDATLVVYYTSNELFFSSLVEVVKRLELSAHPLIAKRLHSLKTQDFNEEQKGIINSVWSLLATSYNDVKLDVTSLSDYEKALMKHVNDAESKDVASKFVTRLIDNPANGDGVILNCLVELENQSVAEHWELKTSCQRKYLVLKSLWNIFWKVKHYAIVTLSAVAVKI